MDSSKDSHKVSRTARNYEHEISKSSEGSGEHHTETDANLNPPQMNIKHKLKNVFDMNDRDEHKEILEDQLIRRILTARKETEKSDRQSEEQDSANISQSDGKEVKYSEHIQEIAAKILSINSHARKFLIFVAACERNQTIFNALSKNNKTKFNKSMLRKFELKSKEDESEVAKIVNDALEYVVVQRAIESLEYILSFCRERYLVPCIQDTLVHKLLYYFENKTNETIIEVLISNDISIKYSRKEQEKVHHYTFNDIPSKIHSPKIIKSNEGVSRSQDMHIEEGKEDEPNYDINNSNPQYEQLISNEYESNLPQRFTVDGEYFKNEHAVEILFRSKAFTENQEIEIITKLHKGTLAIVGYSSTRIIKLLVLYDKFEIFAKIIESRIISDVSKKYK